MTIKNSSILCFHQAYLVNWSCQNVRWCKQYCPYTVVTGAALASSFMLGLPPNIRGVSSFASPFKLLSPFTNGCNCTGDNTTNSGNEGSNNTPSLSTAKKGTQWSNWPLMFPVMICLTWMSLFTRTSEVRREQKIIIQSWKLQLTHHPHYLVFKRTTFLQLRGVMHHLAIRQNSFHIQSLIMELLLNVWEWHHQSKRMDFIDILEGPKFIKMKSRILWISRMNSRLICRWIRILFHGSRLFHGIIPSVKDTMKRTMSAVDGWSSLSQIHVIPSWINKLKRNIRS